MLGLDLAVAPNLPSASQAVDAWNIAPALPAGLLFDSQTGSVSGQPMALSPAQACTVTASGPDGVLLVVLTLSVVRPDSFALSGGLGDNSLSVHVVDPESGFLRLSSYSPAAEGEGFPRPNVVHPGGTPVYVVNPFRTTSPSTISTPATRA